MIYVGSCLVCSFRLVWYNRQRKCQKNIILIIIIFESLFIINFTFGVTHKLQRFQELDLNIIFAVCDGNSVVVVVVVVVVIVVVMVEVMVMMALLVSK